ncbi:DUF7408 domain-containing protein [Gorillibacterium timonense]|uniref:DUF7408 domain-containing protein n=1 Tax=Gorillibacterium timonense TaxID=1689269 RepID=UPI00071CDCFC|nr:hypothetical protein [Gorillibacterium timonense]
MFTKLRTKIVRTFIAILCIGITASAFAPTWVKGTAHAEEAKLTTSIQIGYDGQGQEGKTVPVRVSLTNPNEDLSGDLVITTISPAGGKDVSYVKHVELPKGSTKTVWLSLPVLGYTSKNNKVEFFEGGVGKGKSVELDGKKTLSLNISSERIIGGLTRDPDTLNYLSAIRLPELYAVPLDNDSLPDEPGLLSGLEALVLNDVATDALRPEQIEAIKSWVRSGGTLYLAGGAQYAKTAKAFAELAPMKAEGTVQKDALPALSNFTGKELKLSSPVTLSTGALQEAETLIEEDGIPLLALRKAGLGKVYYFAYDLADPTLNGWSGNAPLWQTLFNGTNNNRGNGPMSYANSFWQIDNALNQFPSIKAPKLGLLALLFAVYVLLVAPVLYLILKKLDRREWAWGIIPFVAVISTGIIYFVGASDKSSTLVHELNRFELDGTGGGSRVSDAAIFVPRGGKFSISLPSSARAMPFDSSQGMGSINANLLGKSDVYLYGQPDNLKVEWNGIPFWSVRKTHWVNMQEEKLGQLKATASIKGSTLSGEVTNETSQDLTDVYVVSAGSLIFVGDLKIGETKSYTGSVAAVFTNNSDIGYRMFSSTMGNSMNPYDRHQNMLSSYYTELDAVGKSSTTRVLGWSKDRTPDFKAKGVSRFDRLNLWVQEVQVERVTDGQVYFPYSSLKAQVVGNTGSLSSMNGDYLELTSGSLEFEYRIPATKEKYLYHDLTLAQAQNFPEVQLEIMNFSSKKWEALSMSNAQHIIAGDISDYLNNNQVLRLRATTSTQTSYWLPQITLEGTVSP